MDNFYNFNLIEDNLHKFPKFRNYYIIGIEGDVNGMENKKAYWDAGDNTKCNVLIYNLTEKTIAWKYVKKSTKGLFINQKGKRLYLSEFSNNCKIT